MVMHHRPSRRPTPHMALLVTLALLTIVSGKAEAAVGGVPPARGPGANFDHQAYAEGMHDAPGILARASVACTVEQAVYEGESSLLNAAGKTVGHARLYEVACSEGLGYMLNVQDKAAPIAFDCIEGGQTGKIACMLPRNEHPAGGLEPLLRAAGVSCRPVRARRIGEDDQAKLRRFEVTCGASGGYVLDIPLANGSGPAPSAVPCIEDEQDCRLTSHVENVAALASRVGRRFGDECRIGDVGYLAARGHQLYEVSCQAGHDGELIEVDATGALKSSRGCAETKLVGAACQLKSGDALDPKIASAEQEAAAPRSPGFKPPMITNPDWMRRPTGSEVERYFPDRAQRSRVSGRAVIQCGVRVAGTLSDCILVDKSPAGFGFGAAALKMAGSFQMRRQTKDGQPVAGAEVMIPINFNMSR